MSLSHGSQIVRNGLVLHYDMSNTQKSWKGAPATNLCLNGEGVYSGGNVPNNWSLAQQFGGLPPINQTSGIDLYGYGYFQFSISGTTSVSNRLLIAPVVFSGVSSTVTPGIVYSFSYNIENIYNYTYGIQATFLWYDINNVYLSASYGTAYSTIGDWSRKNDTTTAPANAAKVTVRFDFINYSTPGTVINFTLRLGGIQWEVGSFATPYIPTTTSIMSRTNTQTVGDLTKNNTITATSLTYTSDNSFSFNGTTDYLSTNIVRPSPSTTPTTYDIWFKNYSNSGYKGLIGASSYTNSGFSVGTMSLSTLQLLYYNGTSIGDINVAYNSSVMSNCVIVFDGRMRNVFRNGVLILSSTASFDALANNASIYIGSCRQGGWTTAQADIPVARVYSGALSATEVKKNFEATRGRYGI